MVVRALLVCAASCLAWGACTSEQCEAKDALVDMQQWQVVAPADDPWPPASDTAFCTGTDIRAEPFGSGPIALDVDTNASCGWATVTQPSLIELTPDDHVLPRVFYFSQQTFPLARAELAVAVDDVKVWSAFVDIPTNSAVVAPDLEPQLDKPAGTPLYFHLGNHGANVWSLLELTRVRQGPCAP